MNKNILLIYFLLSIIFFIVGYFFSSFFSSNNNFNIKNQDISILSNTGIIKTDYLKNILIAFDNVKDLKSFQEFENNFGKQRILFIALKLRNLELLSKYNSYSCILRKCPESGEELHILEKEVIDSLKKKGYYKNDRKNDIVFISLNQNNINEKEKICKENFKNIFEYNSCIQWSLFMEATKDNKYCEKINLDQDIKTLCNDILEFKN